MQKLHIPIHIHNFLLLFEQEYISPKSFYKEQSFGFTRYKNCDFQINEDFITLYTTPFELNHENEILWIVVDKSELSQKNLIDLEENVFLYEKSIYIDTLDYIEFFSNNLQAIKDKSIDASISYLSVKAAEKYPDIKSSFFEKGDMAFVENLALKAAKIQNKNALNAKIENQDYNQYKGLLYYYFSSILEQNQSSEIKNILDNIANNIVTFNANLSFNKSTKKKQNLDFSEDSNTNKNNVLNNIEREIKSNLQALKNAIRKEKISFPIDAKMANLRHEIIAENHGQYAESAYLNALSLLENRFQYLDKFEASTLVILKGKNSEQELTIFKNNLEDLSNFVNKHFANHNNKFVLEKLSHDFIKINANKSIELASNFLAKSNNSKEDMLSKDMAEIILSYFCEHTNEKYLTITNGFKANQLVAIANIDKFKLLLEPKENRSLQRELWTQLFQHFDKTRELIYKNIPIDIIKAFACFMNKMESLEDLKSFLYYTNTKNKDFALAVYGAFHGFASIKKDTVAIFFDKKHPEIIELIKQKLKAIKTIIFDNATTNINTKNHNIPLEIVNEISKSVEEENVTQIKDNFHEKYFFQEGLEVQQESICVLKKSEVNIQNSIPRVENIEDFKARLSNKLEQKSENLELNKSNINALNSYIKKLNQVEDFSLNSLSAFIRENERKFKKISEKKIDKIFNILSEKY